MVEQRTEAYRLLHEMQRWFLNKQALSEMQELMLGVGLLPLVAAHLRPQYVVGEEQEAEAGNAPNSHVVETILNITHPGCTVHCSAIAAKQVALLNR